MISAHLETLMRSLFLAAQAWMEANSRSAATGEDWGDKTETSSANFTMQLVGQRGARSRIMMENRADPREDP